MNTTKTQTKNATSQTNPRTPSFEDAVRAGDARRKLASRLGKEVPTMMTFNSIARSEVISLPPVAVAALHQILACISAGCAVNVVPHDREIEIDEAAPLAGHDPLAFVEALTQLGLPMRSDKGQVFISTMVLGQCLEVIHGDNPDQDPAAAAAGTTLSKAREVLTRRQWHFADKLTYDLKKAGNRPAPETYAMDYYFDQRPLMGNRPQSWPALTRKNA
jgi:hypothetical protein